MSQPINDTAALRTQAIAYLKGELNDEDKAFFETILTESEELRHELSQSRAVLEALYKADDAPIREQVNGIIRDALQKGVSDIHLAPERQGTRLRFRIDGLLHDGEILSEENSQAIVNRWKIMADMDIAERRLPQTGRIPVKYEEKDYELRVSVLPSLYGEKVVARIVSRSNTLVGLDNLNISPIPLDALKRLASLPSGIVITSGSTGTGKTTLLYSLLLQMQQDDPHRSITTIEDPIELALGNQVTQTAVNRAAGLTYPVALSAALRSDSDVIYCTNASEPLAAERLVEAALTGQLVLTSLNTFSSFGIVQRLRDFGIANYLIADSLMGIIGQRLLRRVDDRQTEEYKPDNTLLSRLGLSLSDGPFIRGVASDANNGTGYLGRIPLIEVVEVGDELRRSIAMGASIEELTRTAWANGNYSLYDDVRSLVHAGQITVEDANRVLWPTGR